MTATSILAGTVTLFIFTTDLKMGSSKTRSEKQDAAVHFHCSGNPAINVLQVTPSNTVLVTTFLMKAMTVSLWTFNSNTSNINSNTQDGVLCSR